MEDSLEEDTLVEDTPVAVVVVLRILLDAAVRPRIAGQESTTLRFERKVEGRSVGGYLPAKCGNGERDRQRDLKLPLQPNTFVQSLWIVEEGRRARNVKQRDLLKK